jgi:CarboxypepD_reg-like domain
VLALFFVLQATVGAIKGAVIDSNSHPVPGVTVAVIGSNLSAVTDTLGAFRLSAVPVGRQVIHVGHVALQVDVKPDTAVGVTLMARDIPAPKMVWLGCKPFGTCSQMRYVATLRHFEIPPGVGVIRDSTKWKELLARHADAETESMLGAIIDWSHEMLILVKDAGINRVERHPNRLTVLLGPDSVSGASIPLGASALATVIAVKRTTLPVEYKAILPTTHVPPTIDWSGQ